MVTHKLGVSVTLPVGVDACVGVLVALLPVWVEAGGVGLAVFPLLLAHISEPSLDVLPLELSAELLLGVFKQFF